MGHPSKFERVSHLGVVTARRRSKEVNQTLHDVVRLLRWCTIYTFSGALSADRILPGAKFALRSSLALSYIGSVTARHSSSGRQPNFAALSRGRHLYSAGRPSGWVSAHILDMFALWFLSFFYLFLRLISNVEDWTSTILPRMMRP